MNLTSLATVDGDSVRHCAIKCTITEGCGGVKVTEGNGRKICTMYKEPDGVNVVLETNIYVWKGQ